MSKLKTLQSDLEQFNTLKLVTGALGDIAAMHLKKIRADIKHDQSYFDEISQIYQLVKTIAQKSGINDPTDKLKNGRTIIVLLTSNSGLYGGLDRQLCTYFVKQTQNQSLDRIIIGKAAKDFFETLKNPPAYKELIFKTDTPDTAELKNLISQVKDYSKILFVHAKFITLLDQQVTLTDLTKPPIASLAKETSFHYILEPEVSKMLLFFGTRLLDSMIHSLFLQSELARTGARMISMDQAELSTEELIKQERNLILREQKNRISLVNLDILTKIK